MGSDQHQKFCVAAIDRAGPEQFAEHWDVTDPRHTAQLYGGPAIQKAGNSE